VSRAGCWFPRSALLARDRPILWHDVYPGLSGRETHRLTGGVAEREDIEDVRARPRDVLTETVTEHAPLPRAGQDHVELRVAGGIETERIREVDLGLDDHHVLRRDDLAVRGIDLTDAIVEARVALRRFVVLVAHAEERAVRH